MKRKSAKERKRMGSRIYLLSIPNAGFICPVTVLFNKISDIVTNKFCGGHNGTDLYQPHLICAIISV
jgi:hypothetical protein